MSPGRKPLNPNGLRNRVRSLVRIVRIIIGLPFLIVGAVLVLIGLLLVRYANALREWSFAKGDVLLDEIVMKLGAAARDRLRKIS